MVRILLKKSAMCCTIVFMFCKNVLL
jgi:hypothetical protein